MPSSPFSQPLAVNASRAVDPTEGVGGGDCDGGDGVRKTVSTSGLVCLEALEAGAKTGVAASGAFC